MYSCFYKTIIYFILISIFLKYNNCNIKNSHKQYDIYTIIKFRSLSTYYSSGIKKEKKLLFKDKLRNKNEQKKEFIEDTFVIDCSGLKKLLENKSFEKYDMEIRDSMFKGYEKMYSELYDKNMEKKEKENLFKKFLSLLHRIPSKYIDKMLNCLMQDFVSVPIYVSILFIIVLLPGCAATCISMAYSTIFWSYALVPVFALLLYLKKSESF
ncbi:hypothetical protein PFUGPA_00134 [Plasmodium falciparum Palo Alto/Uganda]|uniref:Uncharacterized protein n=1 Tax=Plasmodium falciparum (isolate Palo Alto / Uganda) TaxID=57270 RepID=W4J6Z2_PLAFP|nr:hypothetical protein PFUGPA_00134 [Plasmodium falciparum Palo Alto/Uganda]